MEDLTRRELLRRGSLGLAVAGVGGWLLRADAAPTANSGHLGDYGAHALPAEVPTAPVRIASSNGAGVAAPKSWTPTEDNILGPYHRENAPFRAKITPPLEPGTTLLVRGRVWGHDTRKPLAGAMMDIWQANAQGRYDNDDPGHPPAKGVFVNRARLVTDESGYYEYETIVPGRYKLDAQTWRPSHIHYLVRQPGYATLVTQLYFKGDPYNKSDEFIKPSLIIGLEDRKVGTQTYKTGTFDIVLATAPAK